MNKNTHNRRLRSGLIALAAIVVMAGAACTPSTLAAIYQGGTVPLDVTLPSQSIDYPFGPCSATLTTPAIDLTGATATIPATTIDPTKTVISIPNVSVVIPETTVSGVTAGLMCGGIEVGTVTFSMTVVGTVVTPAATLNTVTKVVTLTQPTISLEGSSLYVEGIGSIPLPPMTVDLPQITISY